MLRFIEARRNENSISPNPLTAKLASRRGVSLIQSAPLPSSSFAYGPYPVHGGAGGCNRSGIL
jgi:hypothetical protein